MSLTSRILIAMISAIILGKFAFEILAFDGLPGWIRYLLDDFLVSGVFTLIGKIFIASLKLMVVPIVLISLVCGTSNLRDQAALGRIGIKTISLYMLTTGLAISLALFFANLIDPGKGVELTSSSEFSPPSSVPLIDVFVNIFPTNPFQAMASGNMLQIIVFALLLGTAIGRAGNAGERIASQFNDWNEVLMKLVSMLMTLAPYGVFSLLFTLFADKGLGPIQELLLYMLTVVGVLLIHGVLVYGTLLKTLTGLSPIHFLRKMWPVQLFAFSTASSSATLPVSMRNARECLGADNKIASFSLPMGATLNMDGTAIMQGVATVFIAQAFGLELAFSDYLLVIATATLASIGTAGVPGVGLIMLAMVLEQVGLPVEGIALIIGVDRLLDMLRTAVNVTGDAMVTLAVANSEEAIDKSIYEQDKVLSQ